MCCPNLTSFAALPSCLFVRLCRIRVLLSGRVVQLSEYRRFLLLGAFGQVQLPWLVLLVIICVIPGLRDIMCDPT